jgi:hypothetical protein
VFKAKDAKVKVGVYVRLTDGIFDQVGRAGAGRCRVVQGSERAPVPGQKSISGVGNP